MNGVIVVPAVATNRNRYAEVRWIFGATVALATAPQWGWARIAATG